MILTPRLFTDNDYMHRLLEGDALILVCFSGGKDSIAMVLYLLELGVDSRRIILHHHDVDGGGAPLFDWACTTDYCKAFAKAFYLPLLISYRRGGILKAMYRKDGHTEAVCYQRADGGTYYVLDSDTSRKPSTRMKFPAVSANLQTRWCSSEVKIDVLKRAISNNPDYRNTELFVLTGERRQESTARSAYEEWTPHATSNTRRSVMQLRPVINWTEQDVWDIMKAYNVQPHPAYMLGWNRCSCQLCIFNDPNIWATINAISPEKVDKIADIEDDFGFTLYKGTPIRERVRDGAVLSTLDPYWVAQGTKEFTAPIITDNWVLPSGAFKGHAAGAI